MDCNELPHFSLCLFACTALRVDIDDSLDRLDSALTSLPFKIIFVRA